MLTHLRAEPHHPVLARGSHGGRQSNYIASVDRLSKQPPQPELYSRVQYQALARHLSTASDQSKPTPNEYATHVSRLASQSTDPFIHVTVHTFVDGNSSRRHDFDLKDGLARFIDHPQPDAPVDQVIFVRGSLSATWIDALGTKYKIDPEFFRRHLRYLPGRDYADLPSLPSANTQMMTLILPSLYSRPSVLAPNQIEKSRAGDSDVARRNQTTICARMATGETLVRRFSTLSDRLFSVEHEISIFTRSRKNGGRIVVVLLDNGLEMNRECGPPCFGRQDSMMRGASLTGVIPIPIITPRPPSLDIHAVHPDVPKHCDPAISNSNICHVASLLPFYLGMSANARSTSSSILTLICDVFRLVAGAECQFLNQLHTLVQDKELEPADGENMELAISTLRYFKVLLESHKRCLKQNLVFLEAHCSIGPDPSSSTAQGSSAPRQRAESQDDLASILVDFKELLARAENLGDFCTDTAALILNDAMFRESQKAIERADDQKRLTVLAYLFLPASLVFSLFGMNVKEFGTGSQHIWLVFAVLAFVACVSAILYRPQIIWRVLRLGKRLATDL